MKNIYKLIALASVSLFIFACSSNKSACEINGETNDTIKTKIIHDFQIIRTFTKRASSYYKNNGGVPDTVYHSQMDNKSCNIRLNGPNTEILSGEYLYNRAKDGIFIFGKLYESEKDSKERIRPSSAFLISEDGICVSNYHVFKSLNDESDFKYITAFVQDYYGNVYPVEEVLAANKENDISIFRINTMGRSMKPLPLGNDLNPAEQVHIISHPDSRFYTYSKGYVGRKYIKRGVNVYRQAVTAEFARGSSGAPVLDKYGNVIGIVEATFNIDYRPDFPSYQMSVRDIIPVSKIRELINAAD